LNQQSIDFLNKRIEDMRAQHKEGIERYEEKLRTQKQDL